MMVQQLHIQDLMENNKRLESENKSLIIDIGTYVEVTSSFATENERLREALEAVLGMSYMDDDKSTIERIESQAYAALKGDE